MQKQILALAVVTLFASSALVISATDTPETRRKEAERYLQVSPPKALFEDMADKMAANLPTDQRAIQENNDYTGGYCRIIQSDDRCDGKKFHNRRAESVGRFLRLACRKIGDAKIWCLHGGHHAGGAG